MGVVWRQFRAGGAAVAEPRNKVQMHHSLKRRNTPEFEFIRIWSGEPLLKLFVIILVLLYALYGRWYLFVTVRSFLLLVSLFTIAPFLNIYGLIAELRKSRF